MDDTPEPNPFADALQRFRQTWCQGLTSSQNVPREPRQRHRPEAPNRKLPVGVKSSITMAEVPEAFWKALSLSGNGQRWPLYVFGQTGTGKTCAAALVYSKWPGMAMFRPFSQICEIVLGCRRNGTFVEFDGENERVWNEGSFWHRISQVNLLVLDEITRPDLQSREEMLKTVLDFRQGKPTILTGNIPFAGFAGFFGMPIASRVAEGYVLELTGQDRRLIDMEDRFIQG